MSIRKVLALVSMAALFFTLASFAGQPAFTGEKLDYMDESDPGIDYTAEFAAASVPGQPRQ